MIKLEEIIIKEFRGIRNLSIPFNGNNYAICGKNGTGKSGVVDALDFVLTGNISRLSGSGMGNVSLKKHGPHVDSRNNPKNARVTLKITIPTLNKEVTIQRNLENPNSPSITPNDPDVLKILDQISRHPEFVLSRRDLIKYILSTPGDRAKQIQILLHLDKVEKLRNILLQTSNAHDKNITPLKKTMDETREKLMRALDITELESTKILEAINQRRSLINLNPITTLTQTTSFKDGISTKTTTGQLTKSLPKIQALADIKKLKESIANLTSQTNIELCEIINEELENLSLDPNINKGIVQEQFLKSAISMIDEELCPVCDTPWKIEDLKEMINKKLETFKTLTEKRNLIEIKLEPLQIILKELQSGLTSIIEYAPLLKTEIDVEILKSYKSDIDLKYKNLESFIPLTETISSLKNCTTIKAEILELIEKIEKAITAIPDPSTKDAAREYLTICQERIESSRESAFKYKIAKNKADLTKKIYDIYVESSTKFLEKIYEEVQNNFGELYKDINSDDEGDFTSKLIPIPGSLELLVDFHGRDFFPPGAYHSEGHQDSMGICLYLTLMKHLMGDSFTFAILDDVLMSIDSSHRREICRLLQERFTNTQFIFTTHDKVWLNHMRTEQLINRNSFKYFNNWNVNTGPTDWDGNDVWEEIGLELSKDNVKQAAALLRDYLEFISREVCLSLNASVKFRNEGSYSLGDLFPSATCQFKKILKEAEKSATHWGKTEDATKNKELLLKTQKLLTRIDLDGWQTNTALHYNNWADLQKEDFQPLVDSYKELIGLFFCQDKCKKLLYLPVKNGKRESLRCTCTTINLLT